MHSLRITWLRFLLLTAACTGAFAQAATTQVWGVNAAGQIWQWLDAGPWQSVPGGLSQVSVGSDGSVWGVNSAGNIYRRNGNQWQQVPGALVQLSVRNDREVWGVNAGDDIWTWNGDAWVQIAGKLRNVSVGSDGTVWGVNRGSQVFRRAGSQWQQMPGGLAQVAVGNAGNVWGVNAADDIWHWNGSRWTQVDGKLVHIAVATDGTVWGVNRGGAIFRRNGNQWQQMPGALTQLSVAATAGTTVTMANPDYGIGATTLSSSTASAQTTGTITIAGNQAISVAGPSNAPAAAQSLAVGGLSYTIGRVGESQALCGVSGKGLCPRVTAELVGNASNECPAGSFADIGKWSCWNCPTGYSRTSAAVDTERACQRPDTSVSGGLERATFRGYLCPDGSFHDPIRGGECYSCPAGYRRSAAHIDAANACYLPARENLVPARRERNGLAWDCRAGTFWDGWDGGACWSCPPGYARTGNHINSGQACSQAVPEQQHRATLVRKAECGPGEFFDMKIPGTQDPKRGGACYTCPTAYERTASAIDTPQACQHPKGIRFASATQTKPMTCGPGEIFDPINSNSPAVRTHLDDRNARLPGSRINAAVSGGTCWTCPPGARRSGSAVYGSDACIPPGINWQSAGYNQPGLFGLRGAEAVALKLVNERSLINDIIAGIRAGAPTGSVPADYPRRVWQQIATRPQDSTELQMAVFSRVVAAANTPAQATPEEIQLRDDVIEQIRQFRIFLAQDALDAYRTWKSGEAFRRNFYPRSQLQQVFDVGEVPPDFADITLQTILGSLASGAAASTATYFTITSEAVFKRMFPYAYRANNLAARAAATAAARAGTQGTRVAATSARIGSEMAKAAGQAAGGLSSVVASIGPQIIISAGIEILAVAIEQQIDIANAEPKLKAGLATATNTRVDFKRLMATEAGTAQAIGYWSNLMAGPAAKADGSRAEPIAPFDGAAFAKAANAALAARRDL